MKLLHNKINLACLSLCLCIGTLHAQETQETQQDSVFERNLTVEREYTPVVKHATRIDFSPSVLSESTTSRDVTYPDFNRPIETEKTVPTLDRARMAFPTPKQDKGFARVGLGLYWNTLAELNYRLLDQKQTQMNIYANHYGVFRNRVLSETDFGMNLSHRLETSEIYFNAQAANEFFNYYGKCYVDSTNYYDFSKLDTLSAKAKGFWDVTANVGWRSLANSKLDYLLHVGYNYYHLGTGIGTHAINARGYAGGTVADKHTIGVNIANNTLLYMSNDIKQSPRNHLHAEPFYQYKSDRLHIHAGINLDFMFGKHFAFAPSPQVMVEWMADPEMVSLYINAMGSYNMNTPQNIVAENRYVEIPAIINDSNSTYIPIKADIGFKIKPAKGLLITPYLSFTHLRNDVFYTFNTASMTYSCFNMNASVFDAGLTLNYHYQDKLNINFGGAYHHWMTQPGLTVWDKPAWDIWADIHYNITAKWSVQADMSFIGQRKANVDGTAQKLKAGYQINLGGIYTPNKWLSAFLKLNNIAHNQYEQFYAYKTYGFQLLAGVSLAF